MPRACGAACEPPPPKMSHEEAAYARALRALLFDECALQATHAFRSEVRLHATSAWSGHAQRSVRADAHRRPSLCVMRALVILLACTPAPAAPLCQAGRACCGGELQRKRASRIAAEARPARRYLRV